MRLLLIEDYAPIRMAVAQALREEHYAVDVTGDGEEGLWYATSNDYDCVVLDLMLPGIDGQAILRAIRDRDHQSVVIITSARDTVEDRVTGLDAGADDYLIKPFAVAELLARIRALLRRGDSGSRQAVLREGDLVLDPAVRQVRRGDQPLHLGPREYALLEFLLRRRGTVVTREQMWEHAYDFQADISSNVVDVIIARLRRKLQAVGGSPLIHTCRGHGYRLAAEAEST